MKLYLELCKLKEVNNYIKRIELFYNLTFMKNGKYA